MNDPAVAGAGTHADFWERFEHEDVVPFGGQRARDGAADDAAADDYDVGLLDGGAP
jgi:hypothetical protein